jgi:AcrR family transcriptional regulator
MSPTPSKPRQRRKRDPESTRSSILEAAKTILAQDGAEGLSVSSVAKLAGVNRGTAYQHFQVKEDLIRATLELVSHQLLDAVARPIPPVAPVIKSRLGSCWSL